MFSVEEKKKISIEIQKLLLSFNHPEMPKSKPRFKIHVDGSESWSWADIVDPTTAEEMFGPQHKANPWNEVARDVLTSGGNDE